MSKKQTQPTPTVLFFLFLLLFSKELAMAENTKIHVNVGLVLDMNSWAGKMSTTCISMALSDFYASHDHYKTRLVLHTRDSNSTVVGAAKAAVDLLTNENVKAIIGPQTSMQANFVINLGDNAKVPIISFSATSPTLSSLRSTFFIRATLSDANQAKAISSLIQAFRWRAVVPIYADTEFGEGIIPFLTDALQEVQIQIPYRSVIHPLASNNEITAELYKLMTMQTRIFIVHMPPKLGTQLLALAKEVGMLADGFVWIITTGMTNHLSFVHHSAMESLQGVLGVKSHVPRRKKLENFVIRWKRKFQPYKSSVDLNIFGLWAYDTATALAMAVEEVQEISAGSQFCTYLSHVLSRTRFKGLTGDFRIVDGQLESSSFQIVNMLHNKEKGVGFWTPEKGITKNPQLSHSNSEAKLKSITWPGDASSTPKGWVIPTNGKKLRIGIPVRSGINAFVNVVRDPSTNITTFTGFCIDVFDSLMAMLPYYVPYEYVPFAKPNGESAGTYNDLVYQVYLGNYDAAVGDITIRANRSLYADFTQPYTESGIIMVVPMQDKNKKNAWVFLKAITWDLWVTSAAFFVFIGFVIWILEHRTNEDFAGSGPQQVGTGFWFSFSIIVFAHREKVVSNIARFVVIVWSFVVLILTQSYTASLTSMLTVQRLEPTVADVHEVIREGDNVGYTKGSFIFEFLKRMKFNESNLKEYETLDDLEILFTKDKAHGGIAAVFAEVPYMKPFLAKHCSKFTTITPTLKTDGFGFAFPIGSPFVPDISRAILNFTEGNKIVRIEKEWFGQQNTCPDQSTMVSSNRLGLNSFWGLFLIVGIASSIALIIFTSMIFYEHRHQINQLGAKKLWKKFVLLMKCFKKTEEDQDERHQEIPRGSNFSSHTLRLEIM